MECGLIGVISIYKKESPNPYILLTVAIINSYTNHILNRLWRFMEITVNRTVFIRSIIVYIKKSPLTTNQYLFLSLMPIIW